MWTRRITASPAIPASDRYEVGLCFHPLREIDGGPGKPAQFLVVRPRSRMIDVPFDAELGLGDRRFLLALAEMKARVEHLPAKRFQNDYAVVANIAVVLF